MLTPATIQEAIITLLKGQPTITAIVGDDIREDSWSGTQFTYPNLRVALNPYGGYTNGECRPKMSDVPFSIYAYAEGTSSLAAAVLIGTVASAIAGKQLHGTGIVPMSRIDIPEGGVMPPMPEGERLWRGEINCRTILKEAT